MVAGFGRKHDVDMRGGNLNYDLFLVGDGDRNKIMQRSRE